MVRDVVTWIPFIALGSGILAGLGVLHSLKRAFALAAGSILVQMIAWMVIFMIAGVDAVSKTGDWTGGFVAGFAATLFFVLPFTVIGSVISGTVAGLLCRWARRNCTYTESVDGKDSGTSVAAD